MLISALMPMKYLLTLPVLLLLVACGGAQSSDYPPEAIASFMEDCTEQFREGTPPELSRHADSFCTCTIDELQKDVSFEEFQEMEDVLENPELATLLQTCAQRIFSLQPAMG